MPLRLTPSLLPPAILILHAPERVEDAFHQMSTVYVLLVACSLFLFQENITCFHTTAVISIALSPVSFSLLFYSINAFWGEHRLDAVLGKETYLNRGIVSIAAAVWPSIVVYTSLELTRNRFVQSFCDTRTMLELFVLVVLNPRALGLKWLFLSPWFSLTTVAEVSWFVSILLASTEIWPSGERYQQKFDTEW